MKLPLKLTVLAILSSIILISPACVTVQKKDNGKHMGWYKHPHNPHHPASDKPGKGKSKAGSPSGHKGKGKK